MEVVNEHDSVKSANEVYDDIYSKNLRFKKIYDQFVAFRNDQYLWNQVVDLTMDSYMVRFRNQKG